MLDANGDPSLIAQPSGKLFDHDHRTVLAAGAADSDDRMPLVLALIALKHRLQGCSVSVHELAGPGLGSDRSAGTSPILYA